MLPDPVSPDCATRAWRVEYDLQDLPPDDTMQTLYVERDAQGKLCYFCARTTSLAEIIELGKRKECIDTLVTGTEKAKNAVTCERKFPSKQQQERIDAKWALFQAGWDQIGPEMENLDFNGMRKLLLEVRGPNSPSRKDLIRRGLLDG